MKKVYMAPALEIEIYELDVNIASHCGIVVHNGPAEGSHEQCEDYNDPFAVQSFSAGDASIAAYNVHFYEDSNCDCYTTGDDYGYWTS